MHLFHKWTQWKEMGRAKIISHGTLFAPTPAAEKGTAIQMERSCIVCGFLQGKLVKIKI